MPFRSVALTLCVFASGALAADPSDSERIKESFAKWEKAREACAGNYSYEVRWSSAFGFGNRTVVTVKANKVVERKFFEFGKPEPVAPGTKPAEPKPKWVETGKDIGTHKEGAAARTVDQLYAEAKTIAEAPVAEGNRRLVGFDKQGILNFCFVIDTRIADDAPRVGVSPFQLQLETKK